MTIQQLLFYGIATIVVASAAAVVLLRNPVRCALFLVLAFVASAGLWLMAQAEFLALILILVYVGAVMTLFLFVVMMLNIDMATKARSVRAYLPWVLIIVGALLGLFYLATGQGHMAFPQFTDVIWHGPTYSNTKALGEVLYTQYAYPFELAAVLLLIAIIAAISLAHRPTRQARKQDVRRQIQTKRDDCVRVVKMAPEKE